MPREEAPVTVEIGNKTYGLKRREGVLVNIHNPTDKIQLQNIESVLMDHARNQPPQTQMRILGVANKLDEALGRPPGSTCSELLRVMNPLNGHSPDPKRIVRKKDMSRSR